MDKTRLAEIINSHRARDLGLLQEELKTVPHNPLWAVLADHEILRLRKILGDRLTSIAHIGSTSIADLIAKPILDFVGETLSLEQWDIRMTQISDLGYRHQGEHGIVNRRFLSLEDDEGRTYAHLHIFEKGDKRIEDHIRFRDVLRANEAARLEYSQLKKLLLQKDGMSRQMYSEGKAEFINRWT